MSADLRHVPVDIATLGHYSVGLYYNFMINIVHMFVVLVQTTPKVQQIHVVAEIILMAHYGRPVLPKCSRCLERAVIALLYNVAFCG